MFILSMSLISKAFAPDSIFGRDSAANKESAFTRSAISVPQGCWSIRTEFSVGPGKMSVVAILQQLRTL
jgi:hypothetical protein